MRYNSVVCFAKSPVLRACFAVETVILRRHLRVWLALGVSSIEGVPDDCFSPAAIAEGYYQTRIGSEWNGRRLGQQKPGLTKQTGSRESILIRPWGSPHSANRKETATRGTIQRPYPPCNCERLMLLRACHTWQRSPQL
jgi:hypothetical protein